MTRKESINKILSELQEGINLAKCRKCGCMKETLEKLRAYFETSQIEYSAILENIEKYLNGMEQIKYACLGCEYCYPAVAMNVFNKAFPEAESSALSCTFEVREKTWPVVAGEYFAFCDGVECPVAVSTLASVELAEQLVKVRPKELCIVGKTETENIGIDKIIKNTITNPTIRALLLVGKDPEGHYSGRTILALKENGVDEKMRIIASPGKHPILKNVTREEVETFRKQVQVIDMIGCEDINTIVDEIRKISRQVIASCSSCEFTGEIKSTESVQVIQAQEPDRVEMDRAGYFVIIPQREREIIVVEHYSYENKLLRVIEGKDARSIYWTIIKNGWVTQLSHAAYLGKELMKAELSIKLGFKYVQDGQ
jgi:tetrahydromethanopterin S-methyltransferase subunit A